jgi:hypothetical protein
VRRIAGAALLGFLLAGFSGTPPAGGQAGASAASIRRPEPLPPEVVRGHCSVCHSYQLVEAQRLDRANWDWVMEDMIVKFGAAWINDDLRARIVDYLVEHHGPER